MHTVLVRSSGEMHTILVQRGALTTDKVIRRDALTNYKERCTYYLNGHQVKVH